MEEMVMEDHFQPHLPNPLLLAIEAGVGNMGVKEVGAISIAEEKRVGACLLVRICNNMKKDYSMISWSVDFETGKQSQWSRNLGWVVL